MPTRNVLFIRSTRPEHIGALETRNALAPPADPDFDPFLILGHHGPQLFGPGNGGMPFDDHPHRGFETVTFVLDGALVHTDSGGNRQTIQAGGVQWMTAGAGVVHNEQVPPAFKETGGMLEILQLWINLPSHLKMTAPTYIGVQADAIPAVAMDAGAGTLHLVSGVHGDARGPITSLTGVFLSWLDLRADGRTFLPAPSGRTALLYVIRGDVAIGGRAATGGDLVRIDDAGDRVEIAAASDAVVLFGHADPIRQPVAWRGPFVMNSDAEIDRAFREFREGAFGKPPAIVEIA
ncbi:pirin family protein [Sphingomonas sp. 1P08PE]|uniref:pirin family protein n=1 Tax=Sphingomonas sp. 1P08PE TaxID=554122 RepID=UPI0039A33DF2